MATSDAAPLQASSGLREWLSAMPRPADIDWQLRKAEAIRRWCIAQLPVRDGQRVKIVTALNCENGWAPYREALAVGATATVVRIDFNPYSHNGKGAWHANIRLDREWSLSVTGDAIRRFWHGPADETPDGMTPPNEFDQQHYPDGRRHTFSVLTDHLAPCDTSEADA